MARFDAGRLEDSSSATLPGQSCCPARRQVVAAVVTVVVTCMVRAAQSRPSASNGDFRHSNLQCGNQAACSHGRNCLCRSGGIFHDDARSVPNMSVRSNQMTSTTVRLPTALPACQPKCRGAALVHAFEQRLGRTQGQRGLRGHDVFWFDTPIKIKMLVKRDRSWLPFGIGRMR